MAGLRGIGEGWRSQRDEGVEVDQGGVAAGTGPIGQGGAGRGGDLGRTLVVENFF